LPSVSSFVAGHFARDFLDLAFGLLDGALDSILVHVVLSLPGSANLMITIERLRSFRGFSDVARLFFAQSKTGGCRIA